MKQKQLSSIVLFAVITNMLFIALFLIYNWLISLNLSLGFQEYFIILSVGMYTFIIVDTIEIILLRRAQKAWTENAGKTFITSLIQGYDELQKNDKAQVVYMKLAENFWRAGPFAQDEDGKPQRQPGGYVKFEKSDFPEGKGWLGKILNSRKVQDKIAEELSGKARKVDPDLPSVDYGLVKK